MVSPTSIGGANAIGQVTPDYVGSRDEWEDYVIDSLINNYKRGYGGAGGYADGSIGQPNPNDFGTPDKPLSAQTQKYWEDYVRKFGANDPDIVQNFGSPPNRNASFVDDPNSASKLQADNNAWKTGENALDRALERDLDAGATNRTAMQEAGATQRTQMQIDSSWKEATLADATRRYIAEGDWGVQKWVTSENNGAAMARLQMQLQFDREALAQQAVAEKNRHHADMVSLALEVAKYDAELAASPRNWLKYAGWLKARNIVVNGMNLAMASQEVPEESIDPGTVANATGSNVAGLQAQAELQSGASGGSTSSQDAFGAQTIDYGNDQMLNGQAQNQTPTPATMGAAQPTLSPEQIAGATDYTKLAKDLLGMNPLAPTEADVSQENLQGIANGLQTSGRGKIAGFGASGAPTTNALGIEVPEANGKDVNYRQFSSLLPSEQQMKVGAVESVRGSAGISDWVAEMERSRPKGNGSSLAWG